VGAMWYITVLVIHVSMQYEISHNHNINISHSRRSNLRAALNMIIHSL